METKRTTNIVKNGNRSDNGYIKKIEIELTTIKLKTGIELLMIKLKVLTELITI